MGPLNDGMTGICAHLTGPAYGCQQVRRVSGNPNIIEGLATIRQSFNLSQEKSSCRSHAVSRLSGEGAPPKP